MIEHVGLKLKRLLDGLKPYDDIARFIQKIEREISKQEARRYSRDPRWVKEKLTDIAFGLRQLAAGKKLTFYPETIYNFKMVGIPFVREQYPDWDENDLLTASNYLNDIVKLRDAAIVAKRNQSIDEAYDAWKAQRDELVKTGDTIHDISSRNRDTIQAKALATAIIRVHGSTAKVAFQYFLQMIGYPFKHYKYEHRKVAGDFHLFPGAIEIEDKWHKGPSAWLVGDYAIEPHSVGSPTRDFEAEKPHPDVHLLWTHYPFTGHETYTGQELWCCIAAFSPWFRVEV
jgi:hypothetical protein